MITLHFHFRGKACVLDDLAAANACEGGRNASHDVNNLNLKDESASLLSVTSQQLVPGGSGTP